MPSLVYTLIQPLRTPCISVLALAHTGYQYHTSGGIAPLHPLTHHKLGPLRGCSAWLAAHEPCRPRTQ